MARIILEAIKLAPRLIWQFYIQPSKVYDFISKGKDNIYISTWLFFFFGLFAGSITAIPHYCLYGDAYRSILFAFLFALSVVFAVAFAGIFAVAGSIALSFSVALAVAFAVVIAFAFPGSVVLAVTGTVAGAIAGAIAVAFSFAGAFLVALAGTIAAAFLVATKMEEGPITKFLIKILNKPETAIVLMGLSIIFWFLFYLLFKLKMKKNHKVAPLIFGAALILLLLPGAKGGLKSFEAILFPFSFLIGYTFVYYFFFIEINKFFEKSVKRKKTNAENILSQRYEKFQKTSLLWFPLITVLIYLFAHLNEKIKINTSLHIVAVGFVFIPLIIVHVPDYLIYLPLWIRKQQKIMESKNTRESILNFENSILFKHELLFFQLPGLNKILTSYVENKKIGITETVKHIVNLYLFTSQKKQALKAVVDLSKKKAYLHHLFLSLLEFNGDDLIKHLATSNRVAKLYLMLLETIDFKKIDKIDGSNLAWLLRRDIFRVSKNEKREFIPETLESRIYFVYLEMTKEEGYRFNEEMIKTLEADHILLTAEGLKDICRASGKLEEINEFPTEINYFSFIKIISSELKKIKDTLLKINAIERIESRRSTLSDQKQKFEDLINNVVPKLFEPFRHVWNSGLNHCIEVIEKEIQILQGSAVLTIELKNNEILASEKEQNLYFEIFNKGQELATNISITLKTDNHEHFFPGNTMENIDVIESDTVREISFPITAPSTCKTTVRGILTFSDRAKEDKTVEFSFPVTILEKSVEFEEIKNPYIVGQPLKGGSTLFFGREDVYKFIDKNILASGDHHTIVCHGLRRTGKTSLIYQLEAQGFTDKRLVPLNIDMQAVDDEKDFYSTLSSTIVEKLSLHSASPIENFSQFKMFLKEIKPELGKRIIVLMIDEFEELQLRVEEKKFSQTVFSNLRHLMQHEEKLVFLFFGSHKLEEMSADYWSIFFNTAIYLRISHLKREDAIRLIKEPVKGQLTYDDLTVNQILKMTGCQPYLIQLICRMLVNDLNEYKKRNYAVIDDVDNVVEGIIDEGKEHLSQHIWDESNRLEHFILSSAAEELTHKKLDHTGIDTIFDKIKPILPNFYRKQSMQALDKLVSKEVLAEKNMNYWFPINLLRKWIAARYPLRKVKEEI